jgi:hypothetical protein
LQGFVGFAGNMSPYTGNIALLASTFFAAVAYKIMAPK